VILLDHVPTELSDNAIPKVGDYVREQQFNTLQNLPEDREALYHLVWRESAECITVLYVISAELLTKR
jgi:hypothetical protein